jgi:hypothetical protein
MTYIYPVKDWQEVRGGPWGKNHKVESSEQSLILRVLRVWDERFDRVGIHLPLRDHPDIDLQLTISHSQGCELRCSRAMAFVLV